MKRNLISMLGMALLLLLGSCAQETPTGGGPGPGKGTGRLTIEIEGLAGQGSLTRAADNVPSVNGENTIGNLYLLFFDPANGNYAGYAKVDGIPTPNPPSGSDGSVLMNIDGIPYPAGTETDAWDILALANIDTDYFIEAEDANGVNGAVDEWMAQWIGKKEEFVMTNAVAKLPVAIGPNRILMHGRIEKPAGESQLHLLLTRDVARLDVTNNLSSQFDLVSATVWNAFPHTSIWAQNGADANTARIDRHNGVILTEQPEDPTNPTGPTTWPTKIRGGLYAFENHVAAPEGNQSGNYDQMTTCLILGLREKNPNNQGSPGPLRYYRVNIYNTTTNAQNLVRNHAYNITITGIVNSNLGYSNEQEAYLGNSNGLIYHIGDWNEDMNGLVVSDQYSTLSIPTKRIALSSGKDLLVGEDVRAEFRIHTFSTLTNPAPLTIRSQSYTPATPIPPGTGFDAGDGPKYADANDSPIWAYLDGNMLVVTARKLDADNTPRSGVIVLSFAGMEIAMNVSQSGTNDYFLIVTEPDGGILPFAAYAGIPTGLVSVQASGHWTAQLHMNGFSFDNQQTTKLLWTNPANPGDDEYNFTDGRGYNTTLGLLTPDETDPTVDKFRVWTDSHNMLSEPRQAFVVISLDGEDEEGNLLADTYSSIIMLTQTFVTALYYTPSHLDPAIETNRISTGGSITFDGAGGLATSAGYEHNNNWYYVNPGRIGDATSKFNEWQAALVPNGTSDDRAFFEIVRDGNVTNHTHYDDTVEDANKVMVRAKGINLTGRELSVLLRVQTDPGTFADITVTQQPADWELPVAPIVPAEGGEVEIEFVGAPASLSYTVEITGVAGAENHYAYLKDPDEPVGARDPYSKLLPRTTPQSFIVGFPKMIYPNLYAPAAATVRITMAGQTKTLTVTQAAPEQHRIDIFNVAPVDYWWGSLSTTNSGTLSFGAPWNGTVHDYNLAQWQNASNFGPNGKVKTNGTLRLASTWINNPNFNAVWDQVLDSDVRWVHYAMFADAAGRTTANIAAEVNANQKVFDWAGTHEGVVVVDTNNETANGVPALWSPTRITGMMGFTGDAIEGPDGYYGTNVPQDDQYRSRVWEYIVEDGPWGAAEVLGSYGTGVGTRPGNFYVAGYNNPINLSSIDMTEGMYPVLFRRDEAQAYCVIDAKRRIVVSCNAEGVLSQDLGSYERIHNKNLRAWIANCAQYGSHFADYFWDSPRWKASFGTNEQRVVPEPQE